MLKVIPAIVLGILFIWFISTYRVKDDRMFEQIDHGCLIYSLQYKYALEAENYLSPYLWTRVLAIRFRGTVVGHAVTVFVHSNATFVYDPNRGSFMVASYPLYDPLTIAEICFPKLSIHSAVFLEPTLTLNYPLF